MVSLYSFQHHFQPLDNKTYETLILIDEKPGSPITFEVKDELLQNSSESPSTSKDDSVDGTDDEDENQ